MNEFNTVRPLGIDGPAVPPLIFGSSALGNLYQAVPYHEKLAIAREWFSAVPTPVVLDTAGKYGAGLALENIGRVLEELEISRRDVIISNKLGWKRVPLMTAEPSFEPGVWFGIEHDAVQQFSRAGIIECWEQGNELLAPYEARIVSCHDPDEYLAAAATPDERRRRLDAVLESYAALFELKAKGYVDAVGVGAKEWRIIEEIDKQMDLDWVMLACSFTIYRHGPEIRTFIDTLKASGRGIINSALFHAGFLTGGTFFDYQIPDQQSEPELFHWRERFFAICDAYKVVPARACVEFGLHYPGINAVALNTARASRVAENATAVASHAPIEFWQRLKAEGLISRMPGEEVSES